MGLIKNLIGDLLEYGRCIVTEDTTWRENYFFAFYTPTIAGPVLERVVLDNGIKKSAKMIQDVGERHNAQLKKEHPSATEHVLTSRTLAEIESELTERYPLLGYRGR